MSPIRFRRLSDEQLGGRLASGEAAAFDELYRRYVHRLAAYGAHLLGDGAAGDDVAHSTLLKAYGALRDGRVPESVRPWLYRIAHNVAIDLVRRRRELPLALLPEAAAEATTVEVPPLVAALGALPDRQRRVYVLRELHGLRIDETAAELGLTPAQVEQALFAARNRLAEHLVFGDRLTCVSVRRLAGGPLELDERRALKTHLRSCPGCRAALGRQGTALSLVPLPSLDWLRGLTGLIGGGAPAAAKVGALVAGATVAVGVPVAVEHGNPRHVPAADAATPAPRTTKLVLARVRPVPKALRFVMRAAPAPAPVAHPAAAAKHRDEQNDQPVERETASRESEHRSEPTDQVEPPESGDREPGDGG